jgi:hypothetical protein
MREESAMGLTNEQIAAVLGGQPAPVVPPEVGEECVMLRRDVYERLRDPSSEIDFDPSRLYPLIGEIMAEEDVDDPTLQSYQKYKS